MTVSTPSAGLSREEKARLFERLRQKRDRVPGGDDRIPRRPPGLDPIPLSFAQERLWFLDRLQPGGSAEGLMVQLGIHGDFSPAFLAAAFSEVVRRHESLRTTFHEREGRPAQVVSPAASWILPTLPIVDLEHLLLDAEGRGREVTRLAEDEAMRPFDLKRGPLLRATLIRLSGAWHVLLLNMHHIVSDGWSMGILVHEITGLYEALRRGAPSPLPELAIQYPDFAVWQRQWLRGEVLERQIGYWRERLAGAPAAIDLPGDRPRPAIQSFRGETLLFKVGAGLHRDLQALSRRHEATPFMTLLAAFQTLLHRLTGQTDLPVGSPIANRNRAEIAPLIGFFVNTLVLRSDLAGDPPFRDLVGAVRRTALDAFAHQDLPFERLVEELRPERHLSHNPLFQVMFAVQNTPVGRLELPGLSLEPIGVDVAVAKFDLELSLDERDGTLFGVFTYRTDLFDAPTIQRLADQFTILLSGLVEDPGRRLSDLPLLSEAERHQLLEEWNDIGTAGEPAGALQRFEAQAARTPAAEAVVCGYAVLTYGDLDRQSNRLACRLRSLGVGPEVPVGLCAGRSIDLAVGLFGIWKAAGAYVPLDPALPPARLAWMLEDSAAPVVVAQGDLLHLLPARDGVRVVRLDEDDLAESDRPLDLAPAPADLAYLIYTSGTTGRPKAVAIEHRQLAATLAAVQEVFRFGPGDRLPCVAPFSFDIFLFELLGPLLAGGTSVLVPLRPTLDVARLAGELERATLFHAVPALMRQVVEEVRRRGRGGEGVRALFTGGDVVPAELLDDLRRAFPQAGVWVLYGPTETAIVCTAHPVPAAGPARSLLGRPLPGTTVRLCDREGRPVPVGAAGEVWIGGPGVARGYWRRPELTAEKFVERDGLRFFRSGDLARRLADGTLEFLGRIDQQVKIRGFRIELGEIETALLRHPGVREAAVAVHDDPAGGKRLVAYAVGDPETAELRRFLQDELPDYMVPAAFVALDRLPLTAHGKVDRTALPDPERGPSTAEPVAPRTPLEARLVEACREVLQLERVGIADNFFELGGHSLLATQLVSRLRDRWGLEVPVRAVFEAPTLRDLADLITERGLADRAAVRIPRRPISTEPPPLSFAQERLWFLDRLATGTAYNMPMALTLDGDLSVAALEAAFREMVRRHEGLRTTFAEVGDRPVQVIAPPGDWSLLRVDLVGVPAELADAEVRRLAARDVWRPFDLRRGPLLRGVLVRPGARAPHFLFLDMHHIVSDGWSMGVLVQEVAALYAAALEGRPSPLPELPVQYADFAVWQRGWLTGEVLDEQLGYWREQLEGAPVLELPTDRPRPPAQSFRGGRVLFQIGPEGAQGMAALARRLDASLFMALLAACQSLLGRYAGQDDVVFGSAIANRNRAEIEPLIGFFVNSLVLRGDLTGDPSFLDLLGRARRATLDAYSHQDLPFERLVEELRPERRLSHNPLFQVMFALQNAPVGRIGLPGLTLGAVEFEFATTRFDLEIYFWETGGSLTVDVVYDADLFDDPTLRRFEGHLRSLIAGVVADPDRPVSAWPLLSAPERLQLLEWNDTGAALPATSLADLFEEQAAFRPEAVAVASDESDLTYAELDRRATRLARRLAALGVGPEVPVALLAERSPAMIVGLLAILKAGGAYLPLDPAYPAERLAWMREDVGARVLLAHPALLADLPERAREGITVELTAGPEEMEGVEPVRPEPGGLAYVMYTSGSTGTPKGVGVTHRNVVRLVRESRFADLGPDQVFLQLAPISFDASTLEIWAALANGGRLAVLPPYRPSLEEIGAAVSRWGVTTLWLTAGLFHQMVEGPIEGLRPLRQLLAGGDVLSPGHVRRALAALPGCTVINGYGPTEGTTFTCCHPMTDPAEVGSTVPIGTPIGNTRVHVLDRDGKPVPVGVYGELYAGGDGLSRGYLGRPDLTAERFVPDPFATEPGARLYRTGDVVRLRVDGRIEFQGRRDGQVKLRGYRIELGEIESVLARHPEVRDAAVVIQEATDGDKRLVACVVPRPAEEASSDAAEHVAQWQDLYEETYGEGSAPEEDPTFNIQGWNSSYTGEPIPAEEMREWREGTVARLLALPHRRVLEVGCGTGLLLLRVAPEAERYRGTDFSAVALDYVRRQVHELPQVELAQGLADDWSGVGPGDFDLVVLNSVVQYFPGIDYLVRVLEGAVRAVAPGGAVFVGDVRSLPLLEALHTSVELYQGRGAASVAELRRRVARRVADEEELVIDPAFFHALARRLPEISRVEVLHKRGRDHNELTRFRYDVVLHVGEGAQDDKEVREVETLADLERLLAQTTPEAVRIPGLRNARLAAEAAALRLLAPEGPERRTVEELRRAIAERAEPAVEPEDVWLLGERLGYEVRVEVGEDPFRFDAVLWRALTPRPPLPPPLPPSPGEGERVDWSVYANDPLRRQLARRLVPELKHFLEGALPAFMVPGAFVLLDKLPLTVNGKVDRRALAKLEPVSASAPVQSRVAPRTPAEEMVAAVWSEVLGLEGLGIHDDFFELGGHSLLATQVVSRLREAAAVDIPLRTLFEAPTVAALAREIEELSRTGRGVELPPIRRVEREGDEAPVSFAQEWMWLLDRLDAEEGATLVSLLPVRLRGPLAAPALGRALDEVVRRHEVLRTAFPAVEGRPVQRIAPASGLPMPLVDLQALPEAAREAETRALASAESHRHMDLERGPLLRSLLLRLSGEDHTLLVAPHHILFDGWSGGVLLREMAELYGAFSQGRPSPLPELPVQYADYAAWQRQCLQGEVLEGLLGYWRERLAGPLPVLELPGARSGEPVDSLRSDPLPVELGAELTPALRALAREQGATLFVVLLAAFQTLLHRYTRQTDVLVGTSVANRNRPEIEDLIGYFVNTLVLRSDLGGDPTFRELLGRVREVALGAYAHQDLPFTRLVQELQPDRAASRTPLFQAFLQLQNMPAPDVELPGGLEMSGVEAEMPMTTYDLALVLAEGGGGIGGVLWYNRGLLRAEAAATLVERFRILLQGLAADPDRPLSALPLITEAERSQLLAAPARPAGDSGGLRRRFEDRIQDDPEAIAVVFEGDEITYGELDRAAGRLPERVAAALADLRDDVARLFEENEDLFRFDDRDTWAGEADLALWGALLHGGRLVVLPDGGGYDLLESERVTVLVQTAPELARLAAQGKPRSLRWMLVVGETSPQDLAPWFERYGDRRPRLVHVDGATCRPLTAADLP